MANNTAPQLSEQQNHSKTRDILNGMSSHRIDPSRIKITDDKPRAKGGQGVVIFATLVPGEGSTAVASEQMVEVKKLEWARESAKESTKFFKSFASELGLMASLSHPNIIQLIGFVEDMPKGDAWIVLPWEGNGNVREFLKSGEWDVPERVSLIQDVINGVEYLHTREPPVCHGDLKSFNILVNSFYNAVITDFGSARIVRSDTKEGRKRSEDDDTARGVIAPKVEFNPSTLELTLTGPQFSLRWTAPEVLNNGVQDLPSDMWAIGWICWEIITGRIPFEDLNLKGPIISRVVKGQLPAIRKDAELSHILQLCSLMSDCWTSSPVGRIDAVTFMQKILFVPSATPSEHTAGGPKVRSVALLIELERIHGIHDDIATAEFHWRWALDVATRTKDARTKANALVALGDTYRLQSKHREAGDAFEEARDIHSRIGDDRGAAKVLLSLGEIYSEQSNYPQAEKAFKEAYEIDSRIGNDFGAASALIGLGYVCGSHSKDRGAENVLREAHKPHSRMGNDAVAAHTLTELARIYRSQSKYVQAERAYKDASEIDRRIGHNLGAANALRGLAETYRQQSKYPEGEKALQEAHMLYSRVGDDLGAANASLSLGQIHRAQFKSWEAEKDLREAHVFYSRIRNDLGAANALLGLGGIYREQSNYFEAERALKEAHDIDSRIGCDLGAANALSGLGEIYHVQLKYGEAEKVLKEAHEIHSRIGHDLDAANALYRLGEIYSTQSKYLEAEHAFREAYDLHSRGGSNLGVANALQGLVDIYRAQSQYPEAEKTLKEVNKIQSRIGNHCDLLDHCRDAYPDWLTAEQNVRLGLGTAGASG